MKVILAFAFLAAMVGQDQSCNANRTDTPPENKRAEIQKKEVVVGTIKKISEDKLGQSITIDSDDSRIVSFRSCGTDGRLFENLHASITYGQPIPDVDNSWDCQVILEVRRTDLTSGSSNCLPFSPSVAEKPPSSSYSAFENK